MEKLSWQNTILKLRFLSLIILHKVDFTIKIEGRNFGEVYNELSLPKTALGLHISFKYQFGHAYYQFIAIF